VQKNRSKRKLKHIDLLDLQPVQIEFVEVSQKYIEANQRARNLVIKRSIFLTVSILMSVLTIGYYRAVTGEIEALIAPLSDSKVGLDGVLTALRASERLEDRNFLLAPISADLQLDARTALHQEALNARDLNLLDGHERAAYSVAFSPDGEFIISTGQDKTVRVWNFSGPLMPPLTKHENDVLAVEYSSDGDFFVSGDADGVINLWSCRPTVSSRYRVVSETSPEDSSTDQDSPCQWIRTLPNGPSGPSARIARLSISPGSQYIAASSFDGNVYLWKRSSGPEPFQFMKKLPHNGPVFGLDFSPKDRVLVSASTKKVTKPVKEGEVKIWPIEEKSDAPTPTPIASLPIDDLVYDTRFSFDGKLVAIGGAKGLLKVWDRETDKVVDLPGHSEGFVHVLFHPFERRLISADTEGNINLWRPEDLNRALDGSDGDPEDGSSKPIALLGHQGSITRIQLSADGSYLASASDDDTIRLWLTEDGTLLDVMSGHEDEVLNLAFSPKRGGQYGRSYLASSSRDGTIRLWQINNDVRPLKHENRLYDVTFHPDGKVLAASGRGTISLWRLHDYQLLGRVFVNKEKEALAILSVHYSPNGDLLAAGDADGNITLWKHPVAQYKPSGSQANQEEKEPDERWNNTNPDVPIADPGVSIAEKKTSPEIAVVRFHPNSQIIAAGSVDGTVRFWDTQGMLLGHQDIERQDYGITSLDFSRDGKYLVVSTSPKLAEKALAESDGSGSGQIEVYEVEVDEQTLQVSLRPVFTIDESTPGSHTGDILTVVINPANSNEFASGDEDGQIKIWDIEGRLIKTLNTQNGESESSNRNRITRVDYSKDGQLLVSSHGNGTIKFWNLRTGRMISSLKRHKRQVAKVVFNPTDSTMLASAGFDAQVLIWTIPDNFQDKPVQELVAKGCLSAGKHLALEESDSDKSSNKDEKDIRAYCLKNPIVKESLNNNHLARPIQDEH
jgi:WD40 repeat protein